MSSLRRMTVFAGLLMGALLVGTAGGQVGEDAPKQDERVGKILREHEVKYRVDEDGDYRVVFKIGGDRTQLGFIRSSTSTYRNLEIREIWSFAYEAETKVIPADIANRLLEDTFQKKLGAWGKVGRKAVFVVRVSANADAESLISALRLCVSSAEEMEKSLPGGEADRF